MTRNFHRWEVDPFFTAAEEVQDSADRLELVYRTWMHAKSGDVGAHESIGLKHRRRELSTALGTAKWQLEEFERAVSSLETDVQRGASEDTPARHKQFVDALQSQINLIERSLLNSGDSRDLKALPVVRLGPEEKDDLALFLRGSKAKSDEDVKKTLFCASSCPSDGKNDEELTSESVKSSNEVSECFSTSASNSENTLSKADFKRSDFRYRPQEVGFVNKGVKDTSSLEVCIVQDKKPLLEPASEYLHVGKGEISARAGNRSGSTGSAFGIWKSSSADSNGLKNGLINDSTCASKLRPPFFKKLAASDRSFSKGGLKRWKDGDLNATDHSHMLKSLHEPTDPEAGFGSPYIGGPLSRPTGHMGGSISSNGPHSKHWSEVYKMLQSFLYAFSVSRSVHKACAILLALGFAGLTKTMHLPRHH